MVGGTVSAAVPLVSVNVSPSLGAARFSVMTPFTVIPPVTVLDAKLNCAIWIGWIVSDALRVPVPRDATTVAV